MMGRAGKRQLNEGNSTPCHVSCLQILSGADKEDETSIPRRKKGKTVQTQEQLAASENAQSEEDQGHFESQWVVLYCAG